MPGDVGALVRPGPAVVDVSLRAWWELEELRTARTQLVQRLLIEELAGGDVMELRAADQMVDPVLLVDRRDAVRDEDDRHVEHEHEHGEHDHRRTTREACGKRVPAAAESRLG